MSEDLMDTLRLGRANRRLTVPGTVEDHGASSLLPSRAVWVVLDAGCGREAGGDQRGR